MSNPVSNAGIENFQFPVLPPPRFRAEGAKLTGFCETLHGKVAPSGPGDCGPGGRVDPSAGPGCPFPAKQAASEPPRFALPLLTTLSAACPLAPTPKRDAADRQNRLPAFTHPPTDAQRTTVTPSPPARRPITSAAMRQTGQPPSSCASRPKKWRNSRNPGAPSQIHHLLAIRRPAQFMSTYSLI